MQCEAQVNVTGAETRNTEQSRPAALLAQRDSHIQDNEKLFSTFFPGSEQMISSHPWNSEQFRESLLSKR